LASASAPTCCCLPAPISSRPAGSDTAPGPSSRPAHQHRIPIPCSLHWTSPTCAASCQVGRLLVCGARCRRRRGPSRPAHADQRLRCRRCSMPTASIRQSRTGGRESGHRSIGRLRDRGTRQLRSTAEPAQELTGWTPQPDHQAAKYSWRRRPCRLTISSLCKSVLHQ
jgi:hypothetical protein